MKCSLNKKEKPKFRGKERKWKRDTEKTETRLKKATIK